MRQKCWIWLVALSVSVMLGMMVPREAAAQSATIRGTVTDSASAASWKALKCRLSAPAHGRRLGEWAVPA
jgi:hypothetical protein